VTDSRLASVASQAAALPPPRPLISDRRLVQAAVCAYALIFSAFVLYPVFEVVRRSVTGPEGLTLQYFQTYFANPRTYRSLVNSLFVAGLSTVLTVSLAFGFAFVLTRTTIRGRGLLYTLALLPLVAPSFVQALALIFLFGRNGLVTSRLLGLEWSIYGWPGIVISEVFYCFPHAMLILYTALSAIDARLYEAAQSLGAWRWRIFRQVTLPNARYGLASATFLVFNLVVTDFGNPVIIGGDYSVLAVEIYTRVIGLQQFNLAAAMSVILMIPAAGAFLLDSYFGRKAMGTISGAARPSLAPTRGGPRIAAGLYAWGVAAVILLIYATIAAASVVKVWGYDWSFTLDWFRFERLGAVGGYSGFKNSLLFAGIAALVASLLATNLAYVIEKKRPAGARFLYLLAVAPAAIPGTVLGLSYIFAFNKPPLLLTGTSILVVLSMIFRYFTLGLLTSLANVKQIDGSIDEAAQSLGAPLLPTMRRVVWPLMRVAFLSTAVYVFVMSMVTLSAVVFLIPPGTQLAATAVLILVNDGKLAGAAAMSTLIVLVVLTAVSLLRLSTRQWSGGPLAAR
jgi:iron(III) transport system permease protein